VYHVTKSSRQASRTMFLPAGYPPSFATVLRLHELTHFTAYCLPRLMLKHRNNNSTVEL